MVLPSCMNGYYVGTSHADSKKPPFLVDYASNHILCYVIECEFAGPGLCNYNSPILCVSMLCSCGRKMCVSRCELRAHQIPYIVKTTNIEIAELTMRLILEHEPIFTLGHNIYGFDNKILALPLDSDHFMSGYFCQIANEK